MSTRIDTPFPFTAVFRSVEHFLIGDLIGQITGGGLEVWQGADGYLLQRQADHLRYEVRVDTAYQNKQTSITVPARSQQLEAVYSDYQMTAGNSFPNQMEISIATPHLTLQSEMRYSKVAYDEKVELPFAVPQRYTEIQ